MSAKGCSVEGCTRKHKGLGYCQMHLIRVKKNGEVGPVDKLFGHGLPCTIDGCSKPAWGRGLCKAHNTADLRSKSFVPLAAPRVRDVTDATYNAVHAWLRLDFGVANLYFCLCGEQAREWAYLGTDPNGKRELRRNQHGSEFMVEFSTDMTYYVPLCAPCHRIYDKARKGVN